jgi:hypothetical protein
MNKRDRRRKKLRRMTVHALKKWLKKNAQRGRYYPKIKFFNVEIPQALSPCEWDFRTVHRYTIYPAPKVELKEIKFK